MYINMNVWKSTATLFVFFLLLSSTSFSQSVEQKAMAKLSFMIGDWKGTGTSLPKTKNKPYDVLTKVRYDLDGELLVLKHRSTRGKEAVLSLHTIIYYSQKDACYYYYAFRKQGARPFKGQVEGNQFSCYFGDDYRLIFQRTADGGFSEYGEKLVDGIWTKNFEDIQWPTSEITSF